MQAKYRLKKDYQYRYVYKNGSSSACKDFVLLFVKNNTNRLKVGFSVSKKMGKAVVRNRIRRLFKEAFRSIVEKVDARYNYVFVARENILSNDLNGIKKSMLYVLSRCNLLLK